MSRSVDTSVSLSVNAHETDRAKRERASAGNSPLPDLETTERVHTDFTKRTSACLRVALSLRNLLRAEPFSFPNPPMSTTMAVLRDRWMHFVR